MKFLLSDRDKENDEYEQRMDLVMRGLTTWMNTHPITAALLGFSTLKESILDFADDSMTTVRVEGVAQLGGTEASSMVAHLGVAFLGEERGWRVIRMAVSIFHNEQTVVVDMANTLDEVMALALLAAYSAELDVLLKPEEVKVTESSGTVPPVPSRGQRRQ